MSLDQARKRGLSIDKQNKNTKLQVANQNELVCNQRTSTNLEFRQSSKRVIPIDFLIIDGFVNDIILGMDFITQSNINLLISEQNIQFPEFEITYGEENLSSIDEDLADRAWCYATYPEIGELIAEYSQGLPELGI